MLAPTSLSGVDTLALHDALPISGGVPRRVALSKSLDAERLQQRLSELFPIPNPLDIEGYSAAIRDVLQYAAGDRKSTRLNSSHLVISYAVFCLINKDGSIR